MQLHVEAQTDIGKRRQNNEDNFCINGLYFENIEKAKDIIYMDISEGVFCVCDGMGGESFGEYASLAGVNSVAQSYTSILDAQGEQQNEIVDSCVQIANNIICEAMRERDVRIGSTLALLSLKDGIADTYNVGDSRVYLFRDDFLTRLSKDHTVLQMKIDMGIIPESEAQSNPEKHKLTQHLGIYPSEMVIEANHVTEKAQKGDLYILCSDGLTDMVSEEDMTLILSGEKESKQYVQKLVQRALVNGGKDNVTAIVVEVY